MHIHTLKLSITDEEINALLAELPQGDSSIENLRVRLTPEGIVVLGDYPTMLLKMAFETLWEVKGIGSVVERVWPRSRCRGCRPECCVGSC